MIEIRITKEIRDYEPKIVGPFTMRQAICLLIGAPICYFIIKFLSPIFTIDVAAFFCVIPAGIGFAFGWAQPYGMKMEKFLKSIFVNRILAPTYRAFKIENRHEIILNKLEEAYNAALEEEELSKKKKCHKGEKSTKQKKYKLSPKAYK